MWVICFFASACLLLTGITLAAFSFSRKWRHIHPTLCLTVCTYLSAAVAFFPFYRQYFEEGHFPFRAILLSLHNTIRLFVIDCDFDFVKDGLPAALSGAWTTAYSVLFSILYIACPILTFGFVLSFFKNISAYRRLLCTFGRDLYVFSELNQKNLSLAKSLKSGDRRRVIIFTGVDESDDDLDDTLLDDAYRLGAILFKAEIASVGIPARSPKSKIYFIVQGDNSKKNLSYAISLSDSRKNINHNEFLYFFDTTATGDAIFANPKNRSLIVRHINPKQALIYNKLYHHGVELFETAAPPDENGERLISALIVGLGGYGAEMFKALTWLCQMTGYRLKIVGMDKSTDAVNALYTDCPGLFDERINGTRCPGEAQYTLQLVGEEVDATAPNFETKVLQYAADATYILVSLGDDDRNVAAAQRLRQIFEREHSRRGEAQDTGAPHIETIVYDPDVSAELKEARNHKSFSSKICYFGNLDTYFCEEVFFNSDAEEAALAVNTAYGGSPDDFYYCDYNYSSSLASAIHKKLRRDCGMPGTELPKEQRSPEQMEQLAILEHRRWSAYVRSEGYQFGGTEQSRKVDTLAKLHYCLVPFDNLSEEDKRKDYVVL